MSQAHLSLQIFFCLDTAVKVVTNAQAPAEADTTPAAAEVAAAEDVRTKADAPEAKGDAADIKQKSDATQICLG